MSKRLFVAVAAIATVAALAPSPAEAAPGRVAAPVLQGRVAVVTGQVSGPARRPVVLERRAGSRWKVVAKSRTAADRSFTLRARLAGKAMTVRVTAPAVRSGAKRWGRWRSPARTVRATRTRVAFTTTITSKTLTASVRVTRPCKRQKVDLQRATGASWRTVKRAALRSGRATMSVPRTSARSAYRVYAKGCGGASPAVSPVRQVPGAIVDGGGIDLSGPLAYRVLSVTSTVRESGTRATSMCAGGYLGDDLVTEQAQDIPETGGARWKQQSDPMGREGAFVFVSPKVLTTYTHHLRGCRLSPTPQTCTATVHDQPTDRVAPVSVGIFLAPRAAQGSAMFYPGAPKVGFPFASDSQCNVSMMNAPGSQPDDWRRTIPVPAKTLRGLSPFTVAMENTQSWTHDADGKATDLAVHWKVSFVLQRVL